jgi:hypothetical protein
MTIVSDPPGAAVVVNGRHIGATPVDVPSDLFVYYGCYDILLQRDGYEPLVVRQPVPPPWYEWFPLDFFSENVYPCHIKDRRVFAYHMTPPPVVPPDDLLDRANSQRARGQMVGPPCPVPAAEPPPPARLEAPVPGE